MEQRAHNRWPVGEPGSAMCLTGDRFGDIHDVHILDYGDGGLGSLSKVHVEPGTHVSLGFDNPGYRAKRGVVISSTPSGSAHRLSIRFEGAFAA